MAHDRLIIFTRYPNPGKAKTRLIPALGPKGAATVHRQMAEHTLMQVRALSQADAVDVEVQFADGDVEQLRSWLGEGIVYQAQGSGDLGDRLAAACQTALEQGCRSVVIIGTDCPDLNTALLDRAFQALQQQDLVLGPAIDGGYYLIGLRQFVPALFSDIAWSTDAVLQQTVAIAESLGLSIAYLPALADVDRPEDLPIWDNACQRRDAAPSLSIVIPTLNEAKILAKTLAPLTANGSMNDSIEIIVVDGGSQDGTIEVAATTNVRIIHSKRGRAIQMNAGAALARGDVLLFLHGDTRLPEGFAAWIQPTLAQAGVVAGAFELSIDGTAWGLRLVEWGVKWRSRLLQLPYGDQGLFLKAVTFREMGGFPEQPLMEDFELVRRLRQLGRIEIVPVAALTSARRWQTLGIVQTTLCNQLIVLAYYLGVPPTRLAHWYRRRA